MSNVIIPNSAAKHLRELAASLDLLVTRGPGTEERIGSIRAFLSILGTCYAVEPERVETLIRQALRMDEEWCECQMPKDVAT